MAYILFSNMVDIHRASWFISRLLSWCNFLARKCNFICQQKRMYIYLSLVPYNWNANISTTTPTSNTSSGPASYRLYGNLPQSHQAFLVSSFYAYTHILTYTHTLTYLLCTSITSSNHFYFLFAPSTITLLIWL